MTECSVVSGFCEMTNWPEMKYKTSSLSPSTSLVHNCLISRSHHSTGMLGSS